MLAELVVTNLVIVERAALAPGEGLAVITGETGAGKSLLLDALDLVTGARARPGLVGRWGDAATVTAVFQVSPACQRALADAVHLDLPDGQVILRRKVTDAGRSQSWINDVPVALATLRTAADHLVDLHAQHEPIRLADPVVQMRLIDRFGGHEALAETYRTAHQRLLGLEAEVTALTGTGRDGVKELDYLRFQLAEFEALKPVPGELADLEARHRVLEHAEQERELAQTVLQVVRDGDGAMLNTLARLVRRLEQAHDPRMRDAGMALTQAVESVREGVALCDHVSEGREFDPQELEQLLQRLDLWNALLRKHGPDEADLFAAWKTIADRERTLSNLDERVEMIREDIRRATMARAEAGRVLAEARAVAFAALCQDVHAHLAELGMPKARIHLAEDRLPEPGPAGTVRQHILVVTNPGQEPGSIRDIASGGEAARLMLALSAALATSDSIPVIVFDEVDSGVGGRIAGVIGAKLARLGHGRTILAVTHTPQLAAHAVQHVLVRKVQGDAETTVTVATLDGPQRHAELAEMLGGGPQALAQAESLMISAAAPSAPSARRRRNSERA